MSKPLFKKYYANDPVAKEIDDKLKDIDLLLSDLYDSQFSSFDEDELDTLKIKLEGFQFSKGKTLSIPCSLFIYKEDGYSILNSCMVIEVSKKRSYMNEVLIELYNRSNLSALKFAINIEKSINTYIIKNFKVTPINKLFTFPKKARYNMCNCTL